MELCPVGVFDPFVPVVVGLDGGAWGDFGEGVGGGGEGGCGAEFAGEFEAFAEDGTVCAV